MRTLFTFILFLCVSLKLSAQYDSPRELEGLIDNKGDKYFEWAGYDILITKIKTPKNEKDFLKIKKKFEVEGSIKEFSNDSANQSSCVIESVSDYKINNKIYPEIKVHTLLHIIKKNEKESDLISFAKAGNRNIQIENLFLELYTADKLSDYIIPSQVDSIDFVGRTIHLGNRCGWRSPHNINCMGGQISWSIFDSAAKAEDEMNLYIQRNALSNTIIMEEADIDILFEGDPVVARRIVYKAKDYYPLIVYYVWKEIEGKYVSCVMSHYGFNKDDYQLPDLLKEVMMIEEIPDNAWNKYDYPTPDVLSSEQEQTLNDTKKEFRFKHYFINIKTGAYFPLGGQKDFTGTSPYINIGFHLFGYNMYSQEGPNSSLFFDFGLVMPNNRKYFNYYDNDLVLEAKVHTLVSLHMGYLHKKKINRNVYWENYGKIGIAGLITNKDKDDDDEKGNYEVSVFSFGLGSNIRYKRVGLFLEYQFAPYSKSKHLRDGGNSALIAGLNFTF